jgi:hypothetical protein
MVIMLRSLMECRGGDGVGGQVREKRKVFVQAAGGDCLCREGFWGVEIFNLKGVSAVCGYLEGTQLKIKIWRYPHITWVLLRVGREGLGCYFFGGED